MAEKNKTPDDQAEFSRIVKVSSLSNTSPYEFDESPNQAEAASMAALLGAISLKKMRFAGEIHPFGADGWELVGKLGATVTQSCVVTANPVRTRIDVDVRRQFIAQINEDDDEIEIELFAGDESEPLGPEIDLGGIAIEALSLAIPDYPRIEGAEFEETNYSGPGIEPLDEDNVKPFAGLAALKEKLKDNK